MFQNGNGHKALTEYCKIGLMHVPSGRLLTSENFQGSLNVSGTCMKRKQIWTIYADAVDPTAFFFKNHMGRYLSAAHDGKVSLAAEQPGEDERFLIHFDVKALGCISIQSEPHNFYLHWSGTEMRCFSKEPVWWGIRLAIHPQIQLLSVHRNHYVRSAKKDSELRAVQKAPQNPKFILWLEQPPLPNMTTRIGGSSVGEMSREELSRLSKVAIRTQSDRYLCADGSLTGDFDKCTLFAFSFKTGKTPIILFQDAHGDYLTVGAGGTIKVKSGARTARREEFFALESPSIQIRLWGFNSKFACVKHGLSFSATEDEVSNVQSTSFQLEYVGGCGLNLSEIVSTSMTPSADATPIVFAFDGDGSSHNSSLTTGFWRLRSKDGQYWQINHSGSAQLTKLPSDGNTEFRLLFLSAYDETSKEGRDRLNHVGGVVMATQSCHTLTAKTLGAIAVTDRHIESDWTPSIPEVFHMLPFVNRRSVALFSPIGCGFLASSSGRRGDDLVVDCTGTVAEQWFLRHLSSGTCQLYCNGASRGWSILTARSNGSVALVSSTSGPYDDEAMVLSTLSTLPSRCPETEFVFYLASDKHVLLRSLVRLGINSGFLFSGIQGDVRLDVSGTITPGCIWQI